MEAYSEYDLLKTTLTPSGRTRAQTKSVQQQRWGSIHPSTVPPGKMWHKFCLWSVFRARVRQVSRRWRYALTAKPVSCLNSTPAHFVTMKLSPRFLDYTFIYFGFCCCCFSSLAHKKFYFYVKTTWFYKVLVILILTRACFLFYSDGGAL